MKNPTKTTQDAIAKLRAAGNSYREIVDMLEAEAHITSISHLSRIADGQREASEALAKAITLVVRK